MASASKLKVFRTPIGFHDAYVAAASQKAALEAWGSDSDLFAQKAAERVTDPALMAEPLASPGTVIKRLRGTVAEQIAALPPDIVKPIKHKTIEPVGREKQSKATKKKQKAVTPLPRPDRSALTSAEHALNDATSRQALELQELRNRQAALERERRDLEHTHRQQTEILEEARITAESAYERAMKRWRE